MVPNGGRSDKSDHTDRAVAELAKRQHGYVTRRQLLRLGPGPGAIRYRVQIGRLIPVHFGVYAVGHVPTLPLDRGHGVLLACGDDAALSHSSAGTAWEVEKAWRMPFEVTVPNKRRRPGIRIHRAVLAREDVAHTRGLRVTGPARTILDLAPRLTTKALERAVDDLRVARYLRPVQLVEVIARYPFHRGVAALRPLLDTKRGPTRSDLELAFIDFVKQHNLPTPLLNTKVGGYEVDALFARERVIVELDGWAFHSSRASFHADRKRDTELLRLGYVTIRITWERLLEEPDEQAAQLHEILATRRRQAFLRSAG